MACANTAFWEAVVKICHLSLGLGILAYLVLMIAQPEGYHYDVWQVLNTWSWILTVFAYAVKYLNKGSNLLKARNKAVYPLYILHQTITVICGYYLMDLAMHYSLKILIMIIVTFGGSWLIYKLVILNVPFLQPLFGLKNSSKQQKS